MPAKNQTILPAVVVVVVVVVITVQVAFAVMFSDPWTALRAPGAYDYAVICGQGAKSSMGKKQQVRKASTRGKRSNRQTWKFED